jgi:hypothetical protein
MQLDRDHVSQGRLHLAFAARPAHFAGKQEGVSMSSKKSGIVDVSTSTACPALSRVVAIATVAALLFAVGCDRPSRKAMPNLDGATRFMMLDAAGEPLPRATTGGHHCVLDLRTRLVWEIKQAEGLHASDQTYTWYASSKPAHMGEPGEQAGGRCNLDRCDTERFVEAVNAEGYCGASDWRLPTREEVITIGDRRHIDQGIALDPQHFPETFPGEHWTGTTFRMYPKTAWAFDARTALDRADWKTAAKPVRLVRGPLPLSPEAAP